MTNFTPVVAFVAAFAGANGYAATTPDESDLRASRAAIAQQLSCAQVELYCDHDAEALRLLQHARHDLVALPDAAAARGVCDVDKARWLVRQHDTEQAVAALDAARAHLAADAATQRDDGAALAKA